MDIEEILLKMWSLGYKGSGSPGDMFRWITSNFEIDYYPLPSNLTDPKVLCHGRVNVGGHVTFEEYSFYYSDKEDYEYKRLVILLYYFKTVDGLVIGPLNKKNEEQWT